MFNYNYQRGPLRRSVKLMLAAVLSIQAFSAQAEVVTIPVPKALVVTGFNSALKGVRIKVDNYGSKHGTSWLDQQSYLLLPDGSKHKFSVPEQTTKVTKIRKWRHYVNEFNTKDLSVAADGPNLVLTAHFESQGEEIKGKCLRKKINGNWTECSLKMERDIHLNNAYFNVRVTPTPYKGSIAFKSPDASFKADVHIPNKLCQTFKGLCGKIENFISKKIRSAVESSAESQLNKSKVKKAVADAVRNAIKGVIDPKWKVTKITDGGINFNVTVEGPDTIDNNTVSIKGFKVIEKKATMSCPGPVRFEGTISVKTKVKGKAWLEYDNGKKSKKLDWTMPKKGKATSPFTRTWDAKDFKAYNGWARMVLNWKGTDGKTYSKKSAKATFTRTCSKAVGGLKFK